MFVISLHYLVPTETVDLYLTAHSVFLKEQYERGYFLLSGRKIPRTGGLILAQAESRQQIESILCNDPFAQNGVAEYEIIEMQPTMAINELEFLVK